LTKMNDLTDGQLISRYLSGDQEGFNVLVRKWEKRIYNFILRYCGTREEAQDLCQDVFTAAFQRLSSLRDRERFSSWLYTIALNACRMRMRSAGGRRMIPLDVPENLEAVDLQIQKQSREISVNPEQAFSRKEGELWIRQAIGKLSEEQRVVLILKEYEGLKFHEIAEVLGCPVSTIKSRLYLGLEAMRRQWESSLSPSPTTPK
jgi:RNA polymerase sigma-70 factor, ECF subfamily